MLLHPDWSLPSRLEKNPLVWTLELDGPRVARNLRLIIQPFPDRLKCETRNADMVRQPWPAAFSFFTGYAVPWPFGRLKSEN